MHKLLCKGQVLKTKFLNLNEIFRMLTKSRQDIEHVASRALVGPGTPRGARAST